MAERKEQQDPAPELGDRFHEAAGGTARRAIQEYGERIVRQALATARDRESPLVLSQHVEDAERQLRSERLFSHQQSVVQILGAVLVGVFLNGFTAQILAREPRLDVVAIYVAVGFFGLVAVFWSIFR